MGGARNDIELPLTPQQGIGLLVQVHHDLVISPHDQERGSGDLGKRLASQVRPPSPCDDRGDRGGFPGRGQERRSRAGAGSKVSQRHAQGFTLGRQPVGGGLEPVGKQPDVEDPGAILGLVLLQQVDQQSSQP